MAVRNPQPKKPKEYAVGLAIAAVEGSANPLDMDLSGIGESRSDLDLTLPRSRRSWRTAS